MKDIVETGDSSVREFAKLLFDVPAALAVETDIRRPSQDKIAIDLLLLDELGNLSQMA